MAGEKKCYFFLGYLENKSSGDGVGPVAQGIKARDYELRCWGICLKMCYGGYN